MAGIAGIIFKQREGCDDILKRSSEIMLDKLGYLTSQSRGYVMFPYGFFGNVIPISEKENHHMVVNDILGIDIILEGLVYISQEERNMLINEYKIKDIPHENSWLPWMYHHYGNEIVNKLTGWYNVFLYDHKSGKSLMFNDRLGYLPLYIYESESLIMFASKIEALLVSGLIENIEFDPTTLTEHLFFNYPLSDNTYIKNITTLSNASIIDINQIRMISKKQYWSIDNLFGQTTLKSDDSFEFLTYALKRSVQKGVAGCGDFINLSLTGGWDSRVILSFLLTELRHKINSYSFGAAMSEDITIPQFIADQESLKYTPYILDNNYLSNTFTQNAIDTILLSNGTRGYKRAHYLYSIRDISKVSSFILTGIFGDEIFKIAQATGGEVLSKNTIDYLDSDFNVQQTIKKLADSSLFNFLNVEKGEILDEMSMRLQRIKSQMSSYDTISEKYYVLRFEINLRKYFGHEVNSYNDFVYCFSPFIDIDFLYAFAKTKYFGTSHNFNSNSIFLKRQSTRLYYNIVNKNYPPLTKYCSARGYSMQDSKTIQGQIKIMYNKYIIKKDLSKDSFNTKPTDRIFFDRIIVPNKEHNLIFKFPATDNYPFTDKLNSLYFWINRISQRYYNNIIHK